MYVQKDSGGNDIIQAACIYESNTEEVQYMTDEVTLKFDSAKNLYTGQYTIKNEDFTGINRVFKGWNTKADGSGESYEVGKSYTLTSNLNLYAIWGDELDDGVPPIKRYGAIDGVFEAKTKANTVIVARADEYADSLSAVPLAKALKAPILLCETKTLDKRIIDEIKRLEAQEIIVVGGQASISPEVYKELTGLVKTIERIGGGNRYETSALLADELVKEKGKMEKVVLASGETYADALAIGPYAGQEGIPVLLISKDKIPPAIKSFMDKQAIKKITIIGGPTTITTGVESGLTGTVKRIKGNDRYETSLELAKSLFPSAKTAFLASGENFPDALVIGKPAAEKNGPVLLTRNDKLLDPIKTYINQAGIKEVVICGGESSVTSKSMIGVKKDLYRIAGKARIATAIEISMTDFTK